MARGAMIGLALAGVLASCGQPEEASAPRFQRPAIHADGFDPATLDLDRPCTLLREADAERIYSQPYFRTIAADRVEENTVRCAIGVGAGGLHGLVEASVVLPSEAMSAELTYVTMCRAEAIVGPQLRPIQYAAAPAIPEEGYRPAGEAATPATDAAPTPAPPPAPAVYGRACRLANGAYALLLADRVLVAVVRGGGGEVDPEATVRLAALLSRRVGVRSGN